ncbi:hypothetical protein, variant [Aphanomyces astaci]|uniref:Glutamine amidotransferase domain-containing protein n=1 Tax=Aphanomyces astaci TaxID=112090 RepID=W4FR72_APHAT|nr:hypothetical protein, variant [Aphanomyces astaci]ETV69143.1 hypothetical protein, variant [Aphanomyces astaci]|eukprot:XP_009841396.1 hypothetical protein, variant [Aphanomyces astaci]
MLHFQRLARADIAATSWLRRLSTSHAPLRFLIVEGYSEEGRKELVDNGARIASDLYATMLASSAGSIPTTHHVIYPTDGPFELPDLSQFDGVAWTGCRLTVHQTEDPHVQRHLKLARQLYAFGIPQFGSCWASQVAVFAAGGKVAKNPNGREMGLARKIQLTPEGRGHPLYEGKSSEFDAFTSHYDEITHLPPGAIKLGRNAFSLMQAVAVRYLKGEFWGLQYHPEYNLHEMARLTHARRGRLVNYGLFRDMDAADRYVS